MTMMPLILTLDEIGMKLAGNFAIELLEPVRVEAF
jgi:hypothetical protein